MALLKVTNDNFKKEVLESKQKVLVDFNADWCGPCRMLAPEIEKLASDIDHIKFTSINVDEEAELAKEYNVFSIPCLLIFKDGKEVKRSVGFLTAEELKNFIEE